MSVFYTPIPVHKLEPDWLPPKNWCWWRLKLLPNDEGNALVYTLLPPGVTEFNDAVAAVIEIFDDCDTRLDFGIDRDDGVAIVNEIAEQQEGFGFYRTARETYVLDILMGSQPTPCPRWQRLTDPGDFMHPEGSWPPEGHCLYRAKQHGGNRLV